MSGADQGGTPPTRPVPPTPGATLARTPNAEKYVLEADALRRRQLRSALLHGTRRTWREHRSTWPAVLAGVIVVAVIVAGMAVTSAYQRQQDIQERQERQRSSAETPSASVPTPSPTGRERPRRSLATPKTPETPATVDGEG
ncbi:hypothetical protein KV100_04080 [Mumia sp. zg.B21]|uniref:hypothetical protein n=1 Tax=unclassified Mumia TaxID=2621872 RepID=UPI001C6EFB44|nr:MULTISPECIES: hypothetical protein [unclassified Mumia]MBW9208824.1 hypothetical protein [Mumia sp. zg.B21]MDD9349392.1 hypothetical protein [Mumia sp.]